MTDHLRLVKGDPPPELGNAADPYADLVRSLRRRAAEGFAETGTASDVLRSLRLARTATGVGMTLIAGAPGVDKSMAVRRFLVDEPDAIDITAVRGEGGVYALVDLILSVWRDGTRNRSRTDVRRQIVRYLGGHGQMIVVDEAQHLSADAMEWLRAICEEARCDLALVGDLALERAVRAIPQLWSRMARPVVIRAAGPGDAAELAREAGVSDPAAMRALRAVAGLAGGLRNVRAVLDLAALFAGGGAAGPCEVRAAILDIKLSATGA